MVHTAGLYRDEEESLKFVDRDGPSTDSLVPAEPCRKNAALFSSSTTTTKAKSFDDFVFPAATIDLVADGL